MKFRINIFLIAIISFSLVGCGQQKITSVEDKNISTIKEDIKATNDEKKESPKEDEEVIKANFVEINADKWKGKTVYAEGTVSSLDNDSKLALFPNFLLKQQEGDGLGAYIILSPSKIKDIKNGDKVKIIGIVYEKVNSIPSIMTTEINKIE